MECPEPHCKLEEGHKGHHASVAFICDGCGKRRRGQPHRKAPDEMVYPGEMPTSFMEFCFLCSDERVIGRDDPYEA